jgi:tetratricopeptide (TPR) repeat protein
MARFFLGQKSKAKAALEQLRDAVLSANQLLVPGKFDTALAQFDEILQTLKSNTYKQWLENGLVEDAVWTDHLAAALLGRIRALLGVYGRGIEFNKAETMMFDVYALKPDWSEASEYLAGLAVARGDLQAAKLYVDKLFAVNPRHPRARFLQAVFDFDKGDYEESSKALSTIADSAESLCYLARCQLRTQRVEAAIKTFERALSRFGEVYELRYYLGCAFAHAGRYQEARQAFQVASALDTQRAEPFVQLGHLCLVTGDVAEAENYYKSAIAFGTRPALEAHYGLALIATRTGNKQFQAHLDTICLIDVNSELLSCARGDAFEHAGHYEQARHEYQAISPRSAMFTAVLMRRGLMNFRTGDYTGALNLLRQAVQVRPNDNRLLDVLGAAAAVTGEYSLAETVWSQMEAHNAADEKTIKALDNTRLWGILEAAYGGQSATAIKPLEALHKKSGDDTLVSRALADVYFVAAIEALSSEPPEVESAHEFLLLGKHLTAHMKFDYALALADLIAGRFAAAAARLTSLLTAHPANYGAAYHLGLAQFRAGDRRRAEQAFRQGLTTSQKDLARLNRMKWGLVVVLFSEQKWAEALQLLRELTPSDDPLSPETPPLVFELIMRCHALTGDWESAERLAIGGTGRHLARGGTGGRQSALGAILLARRNMKSGRLDAALEHIERYLELSNSRLDADLVAKAKRAVAPLALKTAAQRVRESLFNEAEGLLQQVLSSLVNWGDVGDTWARVNEFLQALRERANHPQRVERLAASYDAMAVDIVLEKDDLKSITMEIPLVLPPKSQRALDQLDRPVFDTRQWEALPHPEFLLAFDS